MPSKFAVAKFNPSGPAKTWEAVRVINAHNTRAEDLPHCEVNGPPPAHLIGSGNLEADMRLMLIAHRVDPDRRRVGGVLAYELVLSASREAFTEASEGERAFVDAWAEAALAFLRKRWGRRVVSAVLHRDEHTPHIHAIIVPLVQKTYARQRAAAPVWALNGRLIAAPGVFQSVQTEYAAAVRHLGLVRGIERSGRKDRPYGEVLREMQARVEEADRARRAADERMSEAERLAAHGRDEQERLAQSRQHLADTQRVIAERSAALKRMQADVEQERAKRDALHQEAITMKNEARTDRLRAAAAARAADDDRAKAAKQLEFAHKMTGAWERARVRAIRFYEVLRELPDSTLSAELRAARDAVFGVVNEPTPPPAEIDLMAAAQALRSRQQGR